MIDFIVFFNYVHDKKEIKNTTGRKAFLFNGLLYYIIQLLLKCLKLYIHISPSTCHLNIPSVYIYIRNKYKIFEVC